MDDTKRHEITVTARTEYVPDQSDEAQGRYVFAYTITIRNKGPRRGRGAANAQAR